MSKSGEAVSKRKPRGFQLMAPARLQEISSMGGKRAHELGLAHRFTKGDAREHGRKGGLATQAARAALERMKDGAVG